MSLKQPIDKKAGRGILVSDFDGTMTERDFFRVALSRLPPGAAATWERYEQGLTSHFDALAAIFSGLRVDQQGFDALLAEMRIDLFRKLDALAPAWLLKRRSGDTDSPRMLGAFNEKTPDWLSFFMFTYFTDRDGKYQLKSLAESEQIPLQTFAMRADLGCGSTVGPIVSASLCLETVDCGAPMLAMHSARETMALADQFLSTRLYGAFLARG